MKSSIGETTVNVGSTEVGKIRVLSVHASRAIFARLSIRMGISLRHVKNDTINITDYQLRAIDGEIQLSESGPVVSNLAWIGARHGVRSDPNGYENQIELAGELDHWRLEALERHRNSRDLFLWLSAWPTLVANSGPVLDSFVNQFQIRIPRESWVEVLESLSEYRFEVFEARLDLINFPEFKDSVQHIREARLRIDAGDFDTAVGTCRKVIEALNDETEGKGRSSIAALIERRTNAKRATEYVRVMIRLKDIVNAAHHSGGGSFSREEARFILRTTTSLLAFVGDLSRAE